MTLIAMDVANEFIEATDCPDDHDQVRNAALLIGEHLANEGSPGHWEVFDAASFFPKVPFKDDHDRTGFALRVMALFQWLAIIGEISNDRAIAVGEAACAAAASPIVEQLHRAFVAASPS